MKTLIHLIAFIACAWTATAQAGTLVDVEVIDRNSGQVLPTWSYHGRIYVAGTPGNRYAVSLRNRSGGRLLTVLSVDGVNAVSGQTAAAQQSGYVLDAGQRAEIAGWRKNLDEVAAFYFTSVADSYAGRTGRPQNVGVIGVAVFREYQSPRPQPWLYQRDSADMPAGAAAPSAKREAQRSQAVEEKLGTGHGERLDSRVGTTEFRRASEAPAEVVTIYYDSRANLVTRGIIPTRPSWRSPEPEAFPGRFVPDPRG